MTTINGESVTPILAGDVVKNRLQEFLDAKEEVKKMYEEMSNIVNEIAKDYNGVPLVGEFTIDGETTTRTLVVGKPKGQFVTYKELDIIMNAKTTKKDLKEVGLD